MRKEHVVYTGSKEVLEIFAHEKHPLHCATRDEVENRLFEEGIGVNETVANETRNVFGTEEEAREFLRKFNAYSHIEQALVCKVVVADYALYEIEYFDDDDWYDHAEIVDLKCAEWSDLTDKEAEEQADELLDFDELPWETITHYMDSSLAEELHKELAPCDNREFLVEYIKKHYIANDGELFDIN